MKGCKEENVYEANLKNFLAMTSLTQNCVKKDLNLHFLDQH